MRRTAMPSPGSSVILWVFLASAGVLAGCGGGDAGDGASGQEWRDEYGAPPPVLDGEADTDPAPALGKEDGAGRLGPLVSWNQGLARVWDVKRAWTDVTAEAGLAWPADSGLDWEGKYAAWVASLPPIDVDGYPTFEITTPQGRKLPAPVLECAEVAVFMRSIFAAWHGLPFYLEAQDAGRPIYIGHFGFKRHDGTNFGGAPDFSRRYTDHTASWTAGAAWPTDGRLRGRGLYGGGDEHSFLPDVAGQPARAGAYFDELLLNKRVGHYLLLALSWFGSMHLADGANMFHVQPDALRPGDVLLERWQRRGIGHTIPVMRVAKTADGRFEVAVATGSMPRRLPKWEEGPTAARYFTLDYTGGPGQAFDGEKYAALGGGLRRWRAPEAVGTGASARYRNTFLPADRAVWIDDTDVEQVAGRIARFGELMKALTPEERRDVALGLVEAAREHLRRYPSSCSARKNRDDAFASLVDVMGTEFGTAPDAVDREHRILEDYVFAELIYEQSKTCCWNHSTAAMFEIVMDLARKAAADPETGECREPIVFRAAGASGVLAAPAGEDGYGVFRDHAIALGRGDEWVTWTADEPCPWAAGLVDDKVADRDGPSWCALQAARDAGAGGT